MQGSDSDSQVLSNPFPPRHRQGSLSRRIARLFGKQPAWPLSRAVPKGGAGPQSRPGTGASRNQGPAGTRAGSRTHTPPAPDEDSSSTWEQSCSYFIVLLISNKIRQKLRLEPGTLFSQEINGKEKGEPGTF